jgi:hypothetical protein
MQDCLPRRDTHFRNSPGHCEEYRMSKIVIAIPKATDPTATPATARWLMMKYVRLVNQP